MVDVYINEGESFESLIRRFSKKVQHDLVLAEVRKRRFFEPPTVARKRKAENKKLKSSGFSGSKF